jgi:acetate kinase
VTSVLVVNAGSSSLKVRWWPHPHALTIERLGAQARVRSTFGGVRTVALHGHGPALDHALALLDELAPLDGVDAVGHRVVHGGERFTEPLLLDDDNLIALAELTPLAPLHNPANLAAVAAARARFPALPHVAVFDTAFHGTLPPHAYLYGLPMALYRDEGIRRYGFHGTSHDYVSQRAAELLERPREELRLVTLHLGNGASAAAVAYGRSVDTSMGLTPLEGLVMGTRSGSVDPGAILYLLRLGYDGERLDDLLQRRSGLLGLSGVSNDVRDIRAAADAGDGDARLALEVFAYAVRKTVGAYAAAMGGLDGVVFTGGIGENDAALRRNVLEGLGFLGIELDSASNERHRHRITHAGSPVAALVVPTDEESVIARAAQAFVVAPSHEEGL